MTMCSKVLFVFLNYCIIASIAIEGDLDKDVEIISGRDVPQSSPLDAKFAGQSYPNDIYGPPVSVEYYRKC